MRARTVPDTRTAILETAERLYAERGVHGVSLREIAEAAGQRNNAAVHYHFGGRDELLRALVERRFVELDRRRRAMLADLDATGRSEDLASLARVLVLPFTEAMAVDGGHWVRFVAKLHDDPRFNPFAERAGGRRTYGADDTVTAATREVGRRIQAVLGIDDATALRRFFVVTTLVVHAVADRQALALAGAAGPLGSPEVLAENLVEDATVLLGRAA